MPIGLINEVRGQYTYDDLEQKSIKLKHFGARTCSSWLHFITAPILCGRILPKLRRGMLTVMRQCSRGTGIPRFLYRRSGDGPCHPPPHHSVYGYSSVFAAKNPIPRPSLLAPHSNHASHGTGWSPDAEDDSPEKGKFRAPHVGCFTIDIAGVHAWEGEPQIVAAIGNICEFTCTERRAKKARMNVAKLLCNRKAAVPSGIHPVPTMTPLRSTNRKWDLHAPTMS